MSPRAKKAPAPPALPGAPLTLSQQITRALARVPDTYRDACSECGDMFDRPVGSELTLCPRHVAGTLDGAVADADRLQLQLTEAESQLAGLEAETTRADNAESKAARLTDQITDWRIVLNDARKLLEGYRQQHRDRASECESEGQFEAAATERDLFGDVDEMVARIELALETPTRIDLSKIKAGR